MSKNKSILDLQTAQSPARTISTTLNIPVCNVYRMYHVIKEGHVERKARGPPLNKKLNPRFLDKLATAVDKAPPSPSGSRRWSRLRAAFLKKISPNNVLNKFC
jgi:hypothetical protein